MASSRWSDLPTDILSTISKILNTDVDILRLRSVCSSWRSSLPPRLRPSPFPLKLPLLGTHAYFTAGDYYLNYSTIYRLSQPEYGPCAGDPSDGWLFRVSEVSPNRFLLLSLTDPVGVKCAPESMPKFLNLLHYRISEISKRYNLKFVDNDGFVTDMPDPVLKKVFVISDDFDLVVFALFSDGNASCWKFGQRDWIPMNTMGEGFADMVVSDGKCYAINDDGVLFYFESNLKWVVSPLATLSRLSPGTTMHLLEHKSDLYVIFGAVGDVTYDFENKSEIEFEGISLPFSLNIFKKCKLNWEYVRCLPDESIISCDEQYIVLPVEDFRSSKGNLVHVIMSSSLSCMDSEDRIAYCGVYDFAEPETAFLKPVRESQLMLWPPPCWLLSD